MKWDRAVHHVELTAQGCAHASALPLSLVQLPVTQLWATGEILGPPRELDTVTVALCVDLPPEDLPWLGLPKAGDHWANLTGLAKNPVVRRWRSSRAPVWNHRIVRPVLIWDLTTGLDEGNLAALREGRGSDVGIAAPTDAELDDRMDQERAISLASLQSASQLYEGRRWGQGKLESAADALWRASEGYLDVLSR